MSEIAKSRTERPIRQEVVAQIMMVVGAVVDARPRPDANCPIVGPENNRVEQLERRVRDLEEHCKKLRDSETFIIPVETLAPEPFILKRSFHVLVCPSDGEFTATFFDANLGMSGDTAEEAVRNLKAVIVDTLEQFEQNESILGPEPARQLAVLREFIQKQV